MSTLDEGQWVPLREAALALGISERTARRRIKGAEIQGRLVASQKGPAYEVWLDSSQPTPALSSQQGSQTPELLAALAQLERQQQTIMELSGRLGFLQSELQQRDEQLKVLQAPREETDPGVSTEDVFSGAVDQAALPQDPARRPWYQRLLFG